VSGWNVWNTIQPYNTCRPLSLAFSKHVFWKVFLCVAWILQMHKTKQSSSETRTRMSFVNGLGSEEEGRIGHDVWNGLEKSEMNLYKLGRCGGESRPTRANKRVGKLEGEGRDRCRSARSLFAPFLLTRCNFCSFPHKVAKDGVKVRWIVF
jgi:hypothetical protein